MKPDYIDPTNNKKEGCRRKEILQKLLKMVKEIESYDDKKQYDGNSSQYERKKSRNHCICRSKNKRNDEYFQPMTLNGQLARPVLTRSASEKNIKWTPPCYIPKHSMDSLHACYRPVGKAQQEEHWGADGHLVGDLSIGSNPDSHHNCESHYLPHPDGHRGSQDGRKDSKNSERYSDSYYSKWRGSQIPKRDSKYEGEKTDIVDNRTPQSQQWWKCIKMIQSEPIKQSFGPSGGREKHKSECYFDKRERRDSKYFGNKERNYYKDLCHNMAAEPSRQSEEYINTQRKDSIKNIEKRTEYLRELKNFGYHEGGEDRAFSNHIKYKDIEDSTRKRKCSKVCLEFCYDMRKRGMQDSKDNLGRKNEDIDLEKNRHYSRDYSGSQNDDSRVGYGKSKNYSKEVFGKQRNDSKEFGCPRRELSQDFDCQLKQGEHKTWDERKRPEGSEVENYLDRRKREMHEVLHWDIYGGQNCPHENPQLKYFSYPCPEGDSRHRHWSPPYATECRYPNTCVASCFDHPVHKDWLYQQPSYRFYLQRRNDKPFMEGY